MFEITRRVVVSCAAATAAFGLSVFLVASGNEQLLVSADTMYVPALLAPHPEWQGVYDQDGPAAIITRRKLIDRVIADKIKICGSHFPFPGSGSFVKDGNAYASRPPLKLNTSMEMKTMIKNAFIGFLSLTAATIVPVVISLPAYAVDNIEATGTPDLTSVRGKIKARDYAGALQELRGLAEDNQQADVYNLLGYTLRKTGDFDTSLTYYTKALELQPDHKAAREYLGELSRPEKWTRRTSSLLR
jgi:tetratricopeptide (TPR) repeat protein